MLRSLPEVMEVIERYAPKNFAPKVGMILGSGFSAIAEQMTNTVSIPYQAIPGLQGGHVAGHASLLMLGYFADIPIALMRGRLHFFENVPHSSVATLVRIIKTLGAHTIILTAAVGSLHEEIALGDLMMITDHINFQFSNPLVGPNDETIGPRFVNLENAYDLGLQEIMTNIANKKDIPLHKGVYISTLGPTFDTPAEIRAFKLLGANVVGMSVVPEVILARHCGLKVVGMTAISNHASGIGSEKVSHEGSLQYGEIGARKLIKLLPDFIKEVSLLE
jgi:xanthosine phosphorylase